MRKKLALAAMLVSAGVALTSAWLTPGLAGNQPAKMKFWEDTPDQADVLAATYVGGKGHEWLVGGGFQPDGTVVLTGNVLGPVLELAVPVQVLGEDRPAPPEAKRVAVLD